MSPGELRSSANIVTCIAYRTFGATSSLRRNRQIPSIMYSFVTKNFDGVIRTNMSISSTSLSTLR